MEIYVKYVVLFSVHIMSIHFRESSSVTLMRFD